ncbi:hypothetical protein ABZ912_38045 [Nonomuraea angiospora]|uniref:hypothetical protein n=1 Tax=Nonomuraea angiospora TaxID=46172 RepID=UPI0033D1D837
MNYLRSTAATCLTVLGVGLALFSACGVQRGDHETGHHHQDQPVAEGALPTASLRRIEAAARCPRPEVQVDAAELHQVACRSPQGRYTILTFATSAGEQAWLGEAQSYGGTYLVGDRWAVVSGPGLLRGLRTQLGGEIEARHH